MRSDDLSRRQVAAIRDAIGPTRRYLTNLVKRMQHRYFPNDDPVWVAALEAEKAMLKLAAELYIAERHTQTDTLPMTDNNRSGYRLGRPRKDTH